MSTVAQSQSHRSEIEKLFIRDAATLMLPVRSSRFGYALYALATTLLRPTRFHGDCAI